MAEEKAQRYSEKKEDSKEAAAYCANYDAHKPGMTKEEVAQYYSKWAMDGGYEVDLGPDNYRGPLICCKAIVECFSSDNREKANVKILDVACGTGFLGEHLNREGFTNLDGLDPADGMIEVAKKKHCYKNFFCEFMDKDVPLEEDTYDCVAIAGGMGESHIPVDALVGMHKIVKPGGYVIIVMREEYLRHVVAYKDKLEPLMQQMQDEGKWVMESRTVVPRYSFDNNGVVFKFKVCPTQSQQRSI